jgi:hypothetical protein
MEAHKIRILFHLDGHFLNKGVKNIRIIDHRFLIEENSSTISFSLFVAYALSQSINIII